LSGDKRDARAGVWSIAGRGTTAAASQCINAKAETQRPTFSEAFQKRRCVVPADGFYEWTGPKATRPPRWIHPRDRGLMLFAGLYETWHPERNKPEVTFSIVTCAASTAIAEIHDRMPVVLDERAARKTG
jgi:putative SOS response-associated peptidase YedK